MLVLNATTLDTTGGGTQSPNTAVAMIVLYAVTGMVSFLFCIIIVSGAIRAVRHPERYGPGARSGDGPDQSRARGLTRAILDTFPIVKFGSPPDPDGLIKDAQTNPGSGVSIPDVKTENEPSTPGPAAPPDLDGSFFPTSLESTRHAPTTPSPGVDNGEVHEMGALSTLGHPPHSDDVIPSGIGRETCPICIVDFELGDDLRVLPCGGSHCFHRNCVDPWLLELSSACPICRQDFIALENMISGGGSGDRINNRSSRLQRFSRYLRFARHTTREHEGEEA